MNDANTWITIIEAILLFTACMSFAMCVFKHWSAWLRGLE